MTPSQKAKAAGFKSLTEVAKMYGCSNKCLYNYAEHGDKFDIILAGCSLLKLNKALSYKLNGE